MDLSFSVDQERFRHELRAWLADNVPRESLPADRHEAFAYRRRWQATLAKAGYVGVHWPVEYGGRGLGPVERLILDEETARAGAPPIAGQIGVSNVAGSLLLMGSDEQKARYLDDIRTGRAIWCQGMSEPNAGSDLANISTRAERDGEMFVVNGQKIWCSDAHEADHCQLYVRTDPGAARHAGITCLLIDMASPGIEVRPIRAISGEAHFNEVFFADARVPADHVLGDVDRGWDVAMATLMYERSGTASLVVMLRHAFDELLALAGGDDRRRLDDILVRQGVAASFAQLGVVRTMAMRMLTEMRRGGVPGPEGSMFKLFWSEAMQSLAELGLRIAGSRAALDGDHAPGGGQLQREFLASRAATIAAGTSEVNRNIIAERALGLPKG